jgi:hypothetical protein
MNILLSSVRKSLSQQPQLIIGLLIFVTCLFVYLANNHTLSSGDNVPNSLIAFNWLFNHSLTLDAFRGTYIIGENGVCLGCPDQVPYFLVEAPNGHLTSTYPVGTAIVTFPLYCFFFIWLKLSGFLSGWSATPLLVPPITDPSFEVARQAYEKLAASILTAASVVLFYLCARLKFNSLVALVITFIFAFATNTWTISSQALWQHGTGNFVLIAVILCLLKANRTEGRRKHLLLLTAGFLCGLIPGIRPTNILFAIAIVVYAVFAYRREVIFFLLGLPSFLLSVGWNFYFFGVGLKNILSAGYSRFSEESFTSAYYEFTPQQFWQGFLGLTINPNRGLLVYSPILLFALPGIYPVFRLRWKKDEQLLGCLTLAAALVFIQYCFYLLWWGGWCYGPRFLTDILPVLCLLIGYCLTYSLDPLRQHKPRIWTGIISGFLVLMLYSTFTQIVGTFGHTNWDGIPTASHHRLWDWQDTQIKRHTARLYHRLTDPIEKPRQYARQTNGRILQVRDASGQPLTSITAAPAQEIILTAQVRNNGKTQWYGYETALGRGEARITAEFFDAAGNPVPTGQTGLLYVSGTPKPDTKAEAIGGILFPSQPGNYRLELRLILQGMKDPPRLSKRPPVVLEAIVAAPGS